MQIYCYANLVLNTITSFVNSTATEMSLLHVPYLDYDAKKVPDAIRDVSYLILAFDLNSQIKLFIFSKKCICCCVTLKKVAH